MNVWSRIWQALGGSARAYEGADTGRLTHGWRSPRTSANAEIIPQAATLRDRSRDLVRNNPLALRSVRVIANSMIGARGIQPRWSQVTDQGLRDAGRAYWDEWSRACDASGRLGLVTQQYIAAYSLIESGEVLARRVLGGSGNIPLRIQLLESDYLDATTDISYTAGERSVGGVVIDETGLVVGYRLRRSHPGEAFSVRDSLTVDQIRAAEIAHCYDPTRPGQLRGVPWLHAIILQLKSIGDHETAELIRREAQATLAMIVRGASPPTTASVTEPGEATGMGLALRDGYGQTMETIVPGTIYYASGAEGIDMTSPQSDPSFRGVAEYFQHKIAAGSSVPFSQLTTDLSAVNYSSYRAGQIDFRAEMMRLRNLCFVPMVCDPIWSWFRAAAATVDPAMLRLPRQASWSQPSWQSVDPQKDADARTSRVRGGLSSLSAEIEDEGGDPEEVFAQLAADRDRIEALGLDLSSIAIDYSQKREA